MKAGLTDLVGKEQVDNLLSSMDSTSHEHIDPYVMKTLVTMVFGLALKRGEVLGLKVGDVRDLEGTIVDYISSLAKMIGTQRIEVHIPSDLRDIILDYLEYLNRSGYDVDDTSPLFPTKSKKGYDTKTLERHLKKYTQDLTSEKIRQAGIRWKGQNLGPGVDTGEGSLAEIKKFARLSTKQAEGVVSGRIQPAGTRRKKEIWSIRDPVMLLRAILQQKSTSLEDIMHVYDKISAPPGNLTPDYIKELINLYSKVVDNYHTSDEEKLEWKEFIVPILNNIGVTFDPTSGEPIVPTPPPKEEKEISRKVRMDGKGWLASLLEEL